MGVDTRGTSGFTEALDALVEVTDRFLTDADYTVSAGTEEELVAALDDAKRILSRPVQGTGARRWTLAHPPGQDDQWVIAAPDTPEHLRDAGWEVVEVVEVSSAGERDVEAAARRPEVWGPIEDALVRQEQIATGEAAGRAPDPEDVAVAVLTAAQSWSAFADGVAACIAAVEAMPCADLPRESVVAALRATVTRYEKSSEGSSAGDAERETLAHAAQVLDPLVVQPTEDERWVGEDER